MTDQKQDLITIGGDLQRSLDAGFQLDLKAVLREGWQLTSGAKAGLLLAVATVLALMFLLIRLAAFSGWLETESERLAESVDQHLKALDEQIDEWANGTGDGK